MPGPTIAEKRGLAPQEPRLDGASRRSAVAEINDLVANRSGIEPDKRDQMYVGRDGFVFDGTKGPDLTRVTFPGTSQDGRRFIIRTFYSGKDMIDPSFEVVYPAGFQNPGTSTQTALDEARRILTPPQPENT